MTQQNSLTQPTRRGFFALGAAGAAAPALAVLAPPAAAQTAGDTIDNGMDRHAVKILPVPDLTALRQSVSVGETELSVLDTGGDGPVVVFLHPASIASDCFAYQLAAFAAEGFRAIAWDRRSYGQSPGGPAETTASDASDFLALLDALGIEKCHAVGVAAGGIRLADFGADHADRLDRVVYACTTLGIVEEDYKALSQGLLPEGFDDLPATFCELSATYRGGNPEGAAEWGKRADAAIPEKRVRLPNANKMDWAMLAGIGRPVLLVTGDADLYSPPSVVALFQSHIPGSQALILDGSAHAVYWEQPEAFNAAVIGFLRGA